MAKINSKAVKEALLDYNNLAQTLKENTQDAVKNLLDEAVRKEVSRIINEGEEDDDYDEEEMGGIDTDTEVEDDSAEEPTETEDGEESSDDESDDEDIVDDDDDMLTDDEGDAEDDDWADFDQYKVSDDEYDLSNASDEDVVKVYKLLNNDDQVFVHKEDDGKVSVKDEENGTEYLIDLDGEDSGSEASLEVTLEDDEDAEPVDEATERVFEVVMNEYNSNVGYTDNYQKKDPMTTPGMSEPGKNVNDWDAGVPKGSSKPWSGKTKKSDKPFNEENDVELEEGATTVSRATYKHVAKNHAPNNPDHEQYNTHNISKNGEYKSPMDESVMRKVNKVFEDNKKLTATLKKFKKVLQEAAVTNVNLGQIIKLISENSTTKDEKQEIISRFGKNAKTVEASKALYETISAELKKKDKMNINESVNLSVDGSKKINETTLYKSADLIESLDLMHRMCK